MVAYLNDYKVGRGMAYFAAFLPGGQIPGGDQFFGDVNALSVSIKATQLDHYQSTGGVKTIDQSATIQSDSSGAMTTENISPANMALFFFGSTSTVTVVGGAVANEVVGPVVPGLYYQLGTAADPVGARGLDSTVAPTVTSAVGSTSYVLNTDFGFDFVRGRVYIIPGGAITSGSSIKVSYTTKSTTRPRIISGQTPIEGQLRFLSTNTAGTDKDWLLPWVKLTPNGSHELIGDKWATLAFDLKVLTKPGFNALYIDGLAV